MAAGPIAGKPAPTLDRISSLECSSCGSGLAREGGLKDYTMNESEKRIPHQPMPLHLFIQGAPWQLQLRQHRLDVAFMPGQRSLEAMRLERFLLRR